MGMTFWIVVAFVVGMLFGRLTARSGAARPGGPTGVGVPDLQPGLKFGQPGSAQIIGNPNGAYRIILLDRGPNIINTIKALRKVSPLDLKGAKDAVESAPSELFRVDTPEQAQSIARIFQGVASIRVDGPANAAAQAGEGGYVPGQGTRTL